METDQKLEDGDVSTEKRTAPSKKKGLMISQQS